MVINKSSDVEKIKKLLKDTLSRIAEENAGIIGVEVNGLTFTCQKYDVTGPVVNIYYHMEEDLSYISFDLYEISEFKVCYIDVSNRYHSTVIKKQTQ